MDDFLKVEIPADIEFAEMNQTMFEFKVFELDCRSVLKRWVETCFILDELKSLKRGNTEELEDLAAKVWTKFNRKEAERKEKAWKVMFFDHLLKEVNDLHKKNAVHIYNFKGVITCNRKDYAQEELFRSKNQLEHLLKAHKNFLVEKKRGKEELNAIKMNRQKIANLLQDTHLTKDRQNAYATYKIEELDMDWQQLEKWEVERTDAVRKQVKLYKLADIFCHEFADNMEICLEALRNDAHNPKDVTACMHSALDKKVQLLKDAKERMDFMGITHNPYTSHTLDSFFTLLHEHVPPVVEVTPINYAPFKQDNVCKETSPNAASELDN